MTNKPPTPEPAEIEDAITRFRRHDNPFGQHPEGLGPTLGEDVDDDVKPSPPVRRG